MVIGGPGSGKSTFAVALGRITGLPVHHMDRIHHLPGWVQRPTPERIRMAQAVEAQDLWIFEGGLSATFPTRAARADAVVFLDLPVALRLCRVVCRWWRWRGRTRPDMQDGCPERLTREFVSYILRSNRRNRRRHATLTAAHPGGVRLRSPRAVARWLSERGQAGPMA